MAERRAVSAAALLPLRLFFGLTFLYAGFDKLLGPAFLDPSNPVSIQAQMAGFARVSPIGGLVQLGEPIAIPIGLVIAVGEIAVGLGTLSGLAFRAAALGGGVLSVLFWLTASWTTHPYYFGPDLPYAVGWLALALAGHGGLLVPSRFLPPGLWTGTRERQAGVASPGRRALLQTGALAVAAVAVASLAVPLRIIGQERAGSPGSSRPPGTTTTPGSPGPTGPSASTGPASPPASGITVATTTDVARTGAAAFTVPFDAPAPLPAGDPAIVIRLEDGTFVAFDAVCTHAGCTVEWDATDRLLVCPCHGAAFDPARRAAVLGGPTDQPLTALPIAVDPASGRIMLRA